MAKLAHIKNSTVVKLYNSKACNVSRTCKALNITRTAWYYLLDRKPRLKQRIQDEQEAIIDFAESQLMENIKAGKETSLIFFLKNKRPNEWHDRKEVDFTGNLKLINVNK